MYVKTLSTQLYCDCVCVRREINKFLQIKKNQLYCVCGNVM